MTQPTRKKIRPTAGIFKGDVGGGVYLGSAFDPFAANPSDGARCAR